MLLEKFVVRISIAVIYLALFNCPVPTEFIFGRPRPFRSNAGSSIHIKTGEYGLCLSSSEWRPVLGSYEHGSKPSGSISGLEFDAISDYWLLNTDSAPWS